MNQPEPQPEPMHVFESGMRRSSTKPRFDLIDSDWLRAVATVLTEGAQKYGAFNWQKADKVAAIDALNHLIDHALKLKDGDVSETHIANMSCNAMFLHYYLQKFPDLFTERGANNAG